MTTCSKIGLLPAQASVIPYYFPPLIFYLTLVTGAPGQTPNNNVIESVHAFWKQNNLGAGHGVKVSLGNFITHSIPKLLEWSVERVTITPCNVVAETDVGPPLPILKAAEKLLQRVHDGNQMKLSDYMRLQTKNRGDGVPFKGFVFNASAQSYTIREENAMTKVKVKQYLNSLCGNLPHGDLQDIVAITHGMHAVEMVEHNETTHFRCDCAGYMSTAECSHSIAARVIEGDFDLDHALSRVIRGRVRGREKNHEGPIGYDAHAPTPAHLSKVQLNNQLKKRVAMEMNDHAGKLIKTYIGSVEGDKVSSFYRSFTQ